MTFYDLMRTDIICITRCALQDAQWLQASQPEDMEIIELPCHAGLVDAGYTS